MGYANVVAAEGDLAGALELLRRMAEQSPTPDLAVRTGDVLRRLGRRDEADRQYALAEAGWRSDAPEPKNLARFLADHDRKIEEAVAIAEAAAADRHDIFTGRRAGVELLQGGTPGGRQDRHRESASHRVPRCNHPRPRRGDSRRRDGAGLEVTLRKRGTAPSPFFVCLALVVCTAGAAGAHELGKTQVSAAIRRRRLHD